MIERINKAAILIRTMARFIAIASFISLTLAHEESITINKPVIRAHQPWDGYFTEYIRCFCNLPLCVSTGYMCKSSEGGCFSDLHDHSTVRSSYPPNPSAAANVYRGRHGCLELLRDSDQKAHCQNNIEDNNSRSNHQKKHHPKSLLLCCYHDMCNHVDSPQTKNLLNNTLLGGISDGRNLDEIENQPDNSGYANSDVWFKAATIAVPICGAVILFVLIALAVKILRSENQHSSSHKLGPAMYIHQMPAQSHMSCDKYNEHLEQMLKKPQNHHQNVLYQSHNEDIHRQIQVPLLEQNDVVTSQNFDHKNETNAKLNLLHCDNINDFRESGKSFIFEIEKNISASPKCSQADLDKNINTSSVDVKFKNDKVFSDI